MTYKGPAEKFNDPVEGKNLKLHEEKLRDAMEWKGDQDIEALANYMVDYL